MITDIEVIYYKSGTAQIDFCNGAVSLLVGCPLNTRGKVKVNLGTRCFAPVCVTQCALPKQFSFCSRQ